MTIVNHELLTRLDSHAVRADLLVTGQFVQPRPQLVDGDVEGAFHVAARVLLWGADVEDDCSRGIEGVGPVREWRRATKVIGSDKSSKVDGVLMSECASE